jgi:hypothetical protein
VLIVLIVLVLPDRLGSAHRGQLSLADGDSIKFTSSSCEILRNEILTTLPAPNDASLMPIEADAFLKKIEKSRAVF